MRPETGLQIAGRYRLEEPLAAGGMGAIWIAKHLQLDIRVAVKFMSDELDPSDGRGRFEREAKAAAKMQSPHVVRTYDYGVEGGTPYIAMELLQGESLEQRLKREHTLRPEDAARIASQVGKGLREAHEHGIVHRDLKPANIFLARVGDEEVAKILDFGIAKETKDVIVSEHTKSGTVIGSPHHMSPEQARGGAVDTRSDLWSFAVVLFRALTGEKPFPGTNMGDVIAKICGDEIPKPSSFAPQLGPGIDAFFERALRRSPDLRFQSVRELVEAFDEAVSKLPRGPIVPREAAPLVETGAVVARTEATREVPARTSIADVESTAVATASDQPHRTKDRRWPRVALGAGVLGVVASAVVFSWLRFGPHDEPLPSDAAGRPNGTSDTAAVATSSPVVSPSAAPRTALAAVPAASSAPAAPSASAAPPPTWRPPPRLPPPKPTSGSPFF